MKKNIAIVMGIAFALFVGCFAWTNMTATKVEKTTVNSMVVDTVDAGTDLVTDALDEVKINYVYDEMVNDPETMDWYRDGYPDMTDEEIEALVAFQVYAVYGVCD